MTVSTDGGVTAIESTHDHPDSTGAIGSQGARGLDADAEKEKAPSRRELDREAKDAAELLQTPSLDELIDAYQAPGRPDYDLTRRAYEMENGQIRDNYYAKHIHAGALIVKPPGALARLTQKRKINLRYDGLDATAVQPEFEAAIWRARALERQSALILGGRSRKVLVEMLYTILVYLLSVLDAAKAEDTADPRVKLDRKRRVQSALRCAIGEVSRLEEFTEDASKKASLRWYLLGLPVGALVGFLLIVVAETWSMTLVGAPTQLVKVCFACGAVGAIVSVMTRISRGLKLIDSQQGHLVTILAGAFRPLIGAIFGLALYVFVQGGLIPIATPEGDGPEALFFAALAFLSGFSERWAQDTIVQSAPLTGVNRTSGPATAIEDPTKSEPDDTLASAKK
jgi:hypothetical protein